MVRVIFGLFLFYESILDSDLIGRKTKDEKNAVCMCMHRHSPHSGCSSSPLFKGRI